MSKEATKSALDMMEEKKVSIDDIEGTGVKGKVTVPDVEKHMEKMEANDESKEGEDSKEGADDGGDSETEESAGEGDEDAGSDKNKSESDAPEEPEKSESVDSKPESEPESGDSDGEGDLICRFTIKGQTKPYKPGDVYKGNNVEHLLKRGAIYRK